MKKLLTFWILLSGFSLVFAEEKIFNVYIDADFSHHSESSQSIRKGVELAFDEINHQLKGYQIKYHFLDHRGNVVRSKLNYEKFIADPHALVIYSGIHSPPLIKNREFINVNKALTLVPWAAGGPITRYPAKENWIFRLSLDDTQVGAVIVDFAVEQKKCEQPHLLLEDTSWGQSNFRSMSLALKNKKNPAPAVTWFKWNASQATAKKLLKNIIREKSDCIILVANANEGATLIKATLDLGLKLPIVSHWGITGGNFHQKINVDLRNQLDLTFIQSCFAFTHSKQTEFSNNVFSRVKLRWPEEIKSAIDLKAAVGFIHAYELTRILIQAVSQTELSGDKSADRNAIRLALENLKSPVKGLLKTYNKPFSIFNKDTDFNAHEALESADYCMATYGPSDEILIIQ